MRTLPAEEHDVLPIFYLELTIGLRRGELAALLWDDLDPEKQTLTVSKSAGRINGEVKVTQFRTANSVWTIYLPKETADLLIQEHVKHPSNPVMFPSPVTGRLYGPDCLGRLYKNFLKKAGITENIPFQGLRHTCATIFVQEQRFIRNFLPNIYCVNVDIYIFLPIRLRKKPQKICFWLAYDISGCRENYYRVALLVIKSMWCEEQSTKAPSFLVR